MHRPARLEALSDGIFAIAITLLVLEIAVPGREVAGHELGEALEDLLPEFFSFVFSFAIIGRYWAAHQNTFAHVEQLDPLLTFMNFAFLLCIAFLPFPTALLGEHLDDPPAAVVYAASMCATGIASTMLWARVARTSAIEPRTARHVLLRAATIPAVFAVSIPAAFVDLGAMTLATVLWIVAYPLAVVAVLVARSRGSRSA